MSGSGSPYRIHQMDLESDGTGGYQDYESGCDPFDIVSTKSASVDRLKRWRQSVQVLNASRRFRYTLDLKKEEEKKHIITKIRTHAQVIRAAYLFQAADEKLVSNIPLTSMMIDQSATINQSTAQSVSVGGCPSQSSVQSVRASDQVSNIPLTSMTIDQSATIDQSTAQSVSVGGCPSQSSVQSVRASDQSATSDQIALREEQIPPNNLSLVEFTRLSDQMEYLNYTLDAQHRVSFSFHEEILYLLYAVSIVVMDPALTQLIQLKFQNNKSSPFESHSFFMYTSTVAYVIAITTLMFLFCLRAYIKKPTMRRLLPSAYYLHLILKTLFHLSAILAPLSLVLVLLIPDFLSWIGYATLFLVFVSIVACNLGDNAKLLYRKCKFKLSIMRAGFVQRQAGPPPRASLV